MFINEILKYFRRSKSWRENSEKDLKLQLLDQQTLANQVY